MQASTNTIRQMRSKPRGSLGRRMALVLLPLVVVPVVFMGSVAYVRTRDILRQQANAQLVSAAESQASTLDQWARTREQRLQLGTQRTVLVEETGNLMKLADVSLAPQASRESLQTERAALQQPARRTRLRWFDLGLDPARMGEHLPAGIARRTAPARHAGHPPDLRRPCP
jgi:hypothetical protein